MAVRKSDTGGSKGSPSFNKSGYRSQKAVDTSSIAKRDGVEDDGFDYEAAARKADESDNSDGYKYQVAVERAKQLAGNDVSDEEMRRLVDNEFAKLSPTATGEQMRGEDNAGAQLVGGFNQALDGVTGFIGDGINGLWDYGIGGLAGGLAGLAGLITGNADENWGQKAFDAVGSVVGDGGYIDGQDIANIGLDIALGAIPGVGVPLVVGKNLAQNADNIREAVTGYDSITGEKLSDDARWANGLAAAANVGLSALPGIGKARNLAAVDDIVGSTDDVGKALAAAAEAKPASLRQALSPRTMVRQATKSADDTASALRNLRSAFKQADGNVLQRANAALGSRVPSTRQMASDILGVARKGGSDAAEKAANEAIEQATKAAAGRNVSRNALKRAAVTASGGTTGQAASQAAGRGARLLERLRPTPEKIRAGIKGGAQNALTSGGTALGGGGMGLLNMAAAQDRGIGDVAGDYVADVTNGGPMNSTVLQSVLPVGVTMLTGGRARSLPGVSGRVNTGVAPALRYAQMANAGRSAGDAAERRMRRDGGMSNEDIEEYLAMIGGQNAASE